MRLAYRRLCSALVAGLGVAAGIAVPALPAHAAVATTEVPFRMDASNQAGWWKPIDVFDGRPYVAYDAWGSASEGGAADRHNVYVARQEANGDWTRGCLKTAAGDCAVYPDDVGHRQPTISIDGDGYIHVFASMHDDNWRYYRSAAPGDVTSIVDRSAQMPDQGGQYTYPSATRTDNGDVYLIVRAFPSGRLYRWNNATNTWSRVATFAQTAGFVVYPDDISSDASGSLHIAWEWAYGGADGLRHAGSYLRYLPASNRFVNAAGAPVTVPATTASSGVAYQPVEGQEQITDRDTTVDPGVQSAKVAVTPDGRPVLAYRYRSVPGGPFRVKLAEWDGGWRRSVVYGGIYDTTAAVDVTAYGSGVRVYYAKAQTLASDQAFAATRSASGTWVETLLLPGVPVERLSVARRGATDHLYLASPGTHQLFYGTNTW